MADLEKLAKENIENDSGHLRVCGWCKGINGESDDIVLKKEDNPEFYDNVLKQYNGKITHGICNFCYEKVTGEKRK